MSCQEIMDNLPLFQWVKVVLSDVYSDLLPAKNARELLLEVLKPNEIVVSREHEDDKIIIEGTWHHITNAHVVLTEYFCTLEKIPDQNPALMDQFSEITFLPATCDNVVEVEMSNDEACLSNETYAESNEPRVSTLESVPKYSRSMKRGNEKLSRKTNTISRVNKTATKKYNTVKSAIKILLKKSRNNVIGSQIKRKGNPVATDNRKSKKPTPLKLQNTKDATSTLVNGHKDVVYIDITLTSRTDKIRKSGIRNISELSTITSNSKSSKAENTESIPNDSSNNTNESFKENNRKSKKVYEETDKFFCSKCSFKTARASHFKKHIARHTPNCQLFTCNECNFVTIRAWILKRHMIESHDVRSVSCEFCSYRTDNMQLLSKHKRAKHSTNKLRQKVKPEVREMCCDDCGYRTTRSYLMERHSQGHERMKVTQENREQNGKTIKCSQCNYATWSDAYLKRHVSSVHRSVPNSHLCETCGKGFKQVEGLKAHVVMHNAHDVRLTCPLCGKLNRCKKHLKAHLKTVHTKLRMFLCDVCGAAFKSKGTQRKHVTTIHENPRAFSCGECSRKFNTKFTLTRHMKMHRLEKPLEKALADDPSRLSNDDIVIPSEPITSQRNQLPIRLVGTNTIVLQDASQPAGHQDDSKTSITITESQLGEHNMTVLTETDGAFRIARGETAAALLYLGSYTPF